MKDSTINDFGAQLKRVVQYTQTESDGRRPRTTRLTESQFARDLVNIQQSIELRTGWKYMSANDGSDGDGLPWQEAIGLIACQFAAYDKKKTSSRTDQV